MTKPRCCKQPRQSRYRRLFNNMRTWWEDLLFFGIAVAAGIAIGNMIWG